MAEKTTGQWVGTIVGAVVGFYTGGMGYVAMGAALGGAAGAAIDPPKGPKLTGPRLSDLSTQTATYGANIPRIYGNVAVSGNVFWIENNALKEVSNTESSGGKGGGGGSESTTYAYYATFAVGLCEGPIVGVRRIWVGSKLFYDAGSSDMGTIIASNSAAELFTLHHGDENQLPDDRMQAALGVANTPAYSGLAYIVFKDLPLKDHGNSLLGAPVKVEVITSGAINTYIPTNRNMPAWVPWKCIVWNGRLFVAVAPNLVIATSPDGIAWTIRSHSLGSASVGGLAWNGRVFLLTTYGPLFAISKDGITWVNIWAPESRTWTNVAWDGKKFIAIQDGPNYATSPDGVSWTVASLPSNRSWSQIGVIGDSTLISQTGGDVYAISKNGGPFIQKTLPETTAGAVLKSNGSIVAIVSGNTLRTLRTNDGESWAVAPLPSSALRCVGWDGDNWIMSENQNIYRSSDLVNWVICCTISHLQVTTNMAWNGAVICIIPSGQTAVTIQKRSIAGSNTTLASIVDAEVLSSNLLGSSDIDVTGLTQQIRGYRVASVGAIRSAIEPLQAAFPFDVVQAGYKIKFKPRGSASVATIQASELDARASNEKPGVSIVNAREMDSILPRRVSLKYLDVDREYDIGEQYAERLNTDAINISALDMPLVMTSTEAAGNAEMLLYLYWLERYDVSFSLPPSYSRLEPADVITVNATEGTYSLRLTSVNYLSDGRLECSAKYNSAAIYSPTAIGEPGLSTGAGLTLLGDTRFALLDIPLLLDATDTPGFPAALCGYLSGWPGGILSRTDDAGQTWTTIQGFTSPGAVIGLASNTIGAGRFDLIDKASALTVNLSSGTLSSVTEAQMLGGANHFAYGAHGRWEIIAAQTCTLQGDGSYVLTNLLRGRFGTEWAAGLHAIADDVVHLDSNKLAFITSNLNSIGVARTYRAVTAGGSPSSAGQESFTYAGVNLECLSPVYLNGNRHPSTNDWSLDWLRRTRIGGEWRDYVDATLGETAQSYEVEIYSSAAYTTLKRTISGLTTPAATYSSANQITDFGSNQATLYVKIYQLSTNVGRGYPLTTSITR